MVKKLFKYEFSALGRILLPSYAVLFVIAGFVRLMQVVRIDHPIYHIAFFSTALFFALACYVAGLMTTVLGVVRYYRHFFTREGYLTFTLPATPTQHLLVKLTTLLAFYGIAMVAVVLSALLAVRLELLVELWRVVVYLLKESPVLSQNIGHVTALAVEYAVFLALGSANGILIFYTCMNLGQLARKGRILWSIGAYFVYYTLMQILSTVLSFLSPLMALPVFEPIAEMIAKYPFWYMHGMFVFLMGFTLVSGLVLFFVSRYILKNRLNLE